METMIKNRIRNDQPGKGKSLIEMLDRYVALDLETTGLDPRCDKIIECSAIRYASGAEFERFSSLVNPGIEIDEFIIKLTGITNEMVENAPTIGEVLPKLLAFIAEDKIVGHNVAFDMAFIYEASKNERSKPFGNDYVDTMRFSRMLFPEMPHHRLRDLREKVGIKNDTEHRSAADAECAAQCYEAMKCYMHEHGIPIEDLILRKKVFKASDVTTERSDFRTDTAIYARTFVFTGTLETCTRRAAMQMVADLGGIVSDRVTAQTNFLVLGNQDYQKVGESGKSSKQRKAEGLQLKGQDIQTISEAVFLSMIAEAKIE